MDFSLLSSPQPVVPTTRRNKIWDGIWGNILLDAHTRRPYTVWMHNAPSPLFPLSTRPVPRARHRRRRWRRRRQLYIYIKYTRHYKFISAVLPELICSLGIAVINFIPTDVSNGYIFYRRNGPRARPTTQWRRYLYTHTYGYRCIYTVVCMCCKNVIQTPFTCYNNTFVQTRIQDFNVERRNGHIGFTHFTLYSI